MLCMYAFSYAQSTLSPISSLDDKVVLDVVNGDTAFMIDREAYEAWWIAGECKHALPLETQAPDKGKNQINTITSEVFSKKVQLGTRQIDLQQQFRFNMATSPITVEIYNSVRGGWSLVQVEFVESCELDASCRRRMELQTC